MIDGPTAAVICSAVLTTGGAIIVAMLKFLPHKGASHVVLENTDGNCHKRLAGLETRVAVVENNHGNMARAFDQLRSEIHELRLELRQIVGLGRPRGKSGHSDGDE